MIDEEIFNPILPKYKPSPKEKVNAEKNYPHTVDCSSKRSFIGDINEHALFADGFDEAIVGYDAAAYRVVYDYNKCMDVLKKRDGMDLHEANEFMQFNVVGSFVGDFTPLFVHSLI